MFKMKYSERIKSNLDCSSINSLSFLCCKGQALRVASQTVTADHCNSYHSIISVTIKDFVPFGIFQSMLNSIELTLFKTIKTKQERSIVNWHF